jgi:phosphatidylserine/phosphatidylglycerophosphate/cardiolipin synthase-like enzyme
VRLIEQAKKRILLAGYGFTSNDIAKAIKEAHARGVIVHLVLDKSNLTSKYSRATYLANACVDVRINSRYAIMHHKFLVVDNRVGFGSMNFTKSANQRNAENFNIFHNAPKLVFVYVKEFLRLYKESVPYRQGGGRYGNAGFQITQHASLS